MEMMFTDQFELTGDYGANVSNKGTLTLKAKDTTKELHRFKCNCRFQYCK